MTRYAALIRGVNVGGVAMKMSDVANVFGDLGLQDVKTVLASGNVLFDSPEGPSVLRPEIEAALGAAFGYQARVQVLSTAELRGIVDRFPFPADREGWHPYVIFVMGDQARDGLLALQPELDPELEQLAAGQGVLYWSVVRGRTLDSVIGKATAATKYKTMITTRNLRTLHKLLV